MKQRNEIVLAGSGGQGLVFSGRVLGQAAILEGKNVVQTQAAYGDSQRGGLSVSELIADREEIIFQQVQNPDLIVALSDRAIKKYADPAGRFPVLYDNAVMKLGAGEYLHPFPFTELAAKVESGAANMVALGAILVWTEIVALDSLLKVLRQNASESSAKANVDSVLAGVEAARAGMNRKAQTV